MLGLNIMGIYLFGYGIGVASGYLIKMWLDLRPNNKRKK